MLPYLGHEQGLGNRRGGRIGTGRDTHDCTDRRGAKVEHAWQSLLHVVRLSVDGAQAGQEAAVFEQVELIAPQHWARHVGCSPVE